MLIIWPLLVVLATGQTQLFDYGEPFGDQVLEYSPEQRAVALDIPIVFLETTQTELYISSDGIIGFGEKIPEIHTPLQKMERYTIAAYYAPIAKGKAFYRSTSSDQHTLRLLCDFIHKVFADSSEFQCLEGVVITWDGLEPAESDEKATFQIALASDGITSYAILQYQSLPWASSSGIYAQSGFSGKHGVHQPNINSGGPDVKQLTSLSNNNEGTSFAFRISGPSIEDPKEHGEDYNYNEYDADYDGQKAPPADCPPDPYRNACPEGCNILTDDRGCSLCVCAEDGSQQERARMPSPVEANRVEEESEEEPRETEDDRREQIQIPSASGTSCDQLGESACHTNGICRDYDNGFCCTCQPGYYGNGKECLKKGDPQRISGFFEGALNGKAVEKTDLHTFITATDGNAYTAVSKIPSDLGGPFLLLQSIGSVMGWLFADVQGASVYNGFQLTGGLFNRTATLHIGDRYYVTIKQEFSGRDIYHYFKANVFVSGSLPDISPDTELVFPDYEEEYKREGPGIVRSYTGMDILLKENGQERTMRMTVDQQIHYKECPFKPFDKDQVTKLQVKRVHVTYDANEGIVRYASRNYVHGQHAASEAAQPPRGSVFERRQHGQTQQPAVEPVQLGNDVCATGRHQCTLQHMRCRPWEQSYRCECFEGFSAVHDAASHIGWKCEDLNECERGDHTCSQDATCTNTVGSFECQCNPGFTGDGHNCLSGSSHSHAASNYDYEPARTNPGECTSHQQCHQYGECAFTPGKPTGVCKCRGWYVGDGVQHCGPPQEAERPTQHNAHLQQRGGKPCGTHVCDQNAECMPTREGGSECVCRAGFEGNGVQCNSLDLEEEQSQTEERPVGTVCRSHDECSEHGSCQYSNQLGYYRCACTEPYVGDGVHCSTPESHVVGTLSTGCDVTRDCHQFADCVFERTHQGGIYRCVCQSGYSGDGKYCTKTDLGVALPPLEQPGCDRLNNCDSNAQCVYDSHHRKYRCECYEGFTGDGLSCVKIHSGVTNWEGSPARPQTCREQQDCHRNAHCVAGDAGDEYICECLPGFRGDGVNTCVIADQCNPHDPRACHQNAECVYGNEETAYVCKCVHGFTGDGVNCVPHGGVSNCHNNPRLCHANAQCVFHQEQNTHVCICKPGSIGDGQTRCDVQDTPSCTDCSIHAHCAQSPTTGGFQCKCNAGYQGNGHLCHPQTSCLDDRSICDAHAECVPGEGGQYVCNCHYGYHGNGRTCAPDSENRKETLFVARGMAIFQRGTKADVPGKQLIVIPHHIAVGLDFDCEQERLVWSDISGHSIRSASLNGTEQKAFYAEDLNSPEGIAVDWSSRNVYYADSLNDEIGVASLDGKYKKALVTEGLVNPRAVALDLYGRHVYYTDWHRENPIIGRVDMDGQNNKIFINQDIHLPNGITVLSNRKELCWVDAGNHRLSCIGFDGNNRRVVHAPLEYPFGITHDNELRFYWTDWKDNKIHTVGVYGEGYSSFPISLGGSGKVYGILSIPKTCPGPTSPCADNNGGCKYLCLPSQNGVKCECPENVAAKGC